MKQKIKILAMPGSLRAQSSHLAILQVMAGMSTETDFVFYKGMGDLPHFNPDLDTDNPPEEVKQFRSLAKQADAILICTPEYAFGVPGSLKNALDWTVSSGEFVDKPTALVTASSSGMHAHAALLMILSAISAKIDEGTSLLIPFIRTKVNSSGSVTDEAVLGYLQTVMHNLIKSTDA